LIAHYESQGLLRRLDGVGSIEAIEERLASLLVD
jgi:hypothetical protein